MHFMNFSVNRSPSSFMRVAAIPSCKKTCGAQSDDSKDGCCSYRMDEYGVPEWVRTEYQRWVSTKYLNWVSTEYQRWVSTEYHRLI